MSKLTDFLEGVAQELKPTLEAGRADAAHYLTKMTLDGPSLAGEASVPGQPGTMTQMDANAAIHWQELAGSAGESMSAREAAEMDTGYGQWLAEQAAAASRPQQQQQMEIG